MTTGELIHDPDPGLARRARSAGVLWLVRAAVFALAIGAIAPASATTIVPMTIDQFTDASTYIVEGKVTAVWTELDAASGLVWTKARVAVTTTYKGPDDPAELVVASLGGDYGDYSVWMPSMAVFSQDEDVFLFLAEAKNGRLSPVSKFAGKYTIRRAPGETASYARLWEPAKGERFDARFLPHPLPEHRLYLADLRSEVQAHLAEEWDGKPIPGISAEKLSEINTHLRRSR